MKYIQLFIIKRTIDLTYIGITNLHKEIIGFSNEKPTINVLWCIFNYAAKLLIYSIVMFGSYSPHLMRGDKKITEDPEYRSWAKPKPSEQACRAEHAVHHTRRIIAHQPHTLRLDGLRPHTKNSSPPTGFLMCSWDSNKQTIYRTDFFSIFVWSGDKKQNANKFFENGSDFFFYFAD